MNVPYGERERSREIRRRELMKAAVGLRVCVQARDIAIAGHTVSVVESSLSDGLGARLWSVSFMLCR